LRHALRVPAQAVERLAAVIRNVKPLRITRHAGLRLEDLDARADYLTQERSRIGAPQLVEKPRAILLDMGEDYMFGMRQTPQVRCLIFQ
jgi:hypothetical protein